jgi:hypothetical protein
VTPDHAAPLKPSAPRLFIVRWVRADGTETKHRTFLRRHPAERFHAKLLDHGCEAALFSSAASWAEEA